MDFFTHRYYNCNRLLFIIIGLWPYQNFRTRLIRSTIALTYYGFFLLGQIVKLTEVSNFDAIFEILVSLLSNIICIIRFINTMVYMNGFLKMFEDIKNLWDTTVVKEEIEIIKSCAEEGRRYTLFLVVFSYSTFGSVALGSLIPCILDAVVPLNHTRTRKFMFEAEFFIDPEKYFYPLLLHTWVTIFFSVTALVATESIFLVYGQHCCSMLKILCYRFEHVFEKNLENTNTDDAYYEARKRISDCIKYHKRILEFIANIISFYEISFFIQFLIIVLLLSIAYIQIAVLFGKYEGLMYVALTGGIFYHTFLVCYPMQKILDCNNVLVENARNMCRYGGPWYFAPIKAQKLLLPIIKRNNNSTPIIMLGLVSVTYENFGMIIKTSMSYFTVLYSFR